MNVVVTGAGGFVGRELVRSLLERGHRVVGIDSAAGGIPEGAGAIAGDLGDPAIRAQALAGGCDALIHLATVPGGAAEADPAPLPGDVEAVAARLVKPGPPRPATPAAAP